MSPKEKLIRITVASLLGIGVIFMFIFSHKKTPSNSKQSIVVNDWTSQESVMQAMQGTWHYSDFIVSGEGTYKGVEGIVTINGNNINLSLNVDKKGYEDWGRPNETFSFDKVEEYHPCDNMKETEFTRRYKFSILSGGELEVRNSDGDCTEKFFLNGYQLYR